jgi:hypothetical protein
MKPQSYQHFRPLLDHLFHIKSKFPKRLISITLDQDVQLLLLATFHILYLLDGKISLENGLHLFVYGEAVSCSGEPEK